jgi:RNA polymerase sigma-70 factor (ECF subfamily)
MDEIAQHRPVIVGHCYRMLGSLVEAEDATQDTLVRAVRALDRFEGRSALRTWLLRIATNVCLDVLKRRTRRRERPMDHPPGTPAGPFEPTPAEDWVEPLPDAWVVPADAGPEAIATTRRNIRLAFVTALQHLPPRQRAALLLTDVVGMSAKEAAATLDSSVPSLNSALQRARRTLATLERPVRPTPEDADVVERYARAFEAYDTAGLVRLLTDDVAFQMPPIPLWVQGPAMVAAFLEGPGAECEGSILVPVRASGGPAFAQYRQGGRLAWGLVTLELTDGRISGIDTFLDVEALFPRFDLPMQWPRAGGARKSDADR